MLTRVSGLTLASAAVFLAGTQGALAIDAEDFGGKLIAASKLMGLSFAYASATTEGDTVTLSDFTIKVPGEEDTELPGDLVFEGVVEVGDGSYTAQTATIDDIAMEEDGMAFQFENIVAEGLTIPASATLADALEVTTSLYERVSAGPLTATVEGTEVFAVDLMEVEIDEDQGNGGFGTRYEVSGIRGDLTTIEDAEAQAFVEAFGVRQISGSLSGHGTWFPEDGTAEIDEMRYTLDDLGSLNITFSISGYTMEIFNEMMKINLKMAELAEAGEEFSEEQMEATEEAMLEKFSDLKLDSAAIRYDDASLFMKTVDYVAAEQGVDGATFANGLKFMVPMLLTELQNAEFTAMVTGAVNSFVDNPQNFEVAAEPENPVGMEEFVAAEEDPTALIDVLNVQVRANQ